MEKWGGKNNGFLGGRGEEGVDGGKSGWLGREL